MLDSKKVMLLAASIVFLCAVFLSLSFLFSSPHEKKQKQKMQEPSAAENISSRKEAAASSMAENPQKAPEKKKEAVPALPQKPAEKKEISSAVQQPVSEKKSPQKPADTVSVPEKKSLQSLPMIPPERKPEPAPDAKKNPPKETPPSAEKKTASRYAIPAAQNGATLVFIFDDGGYDTANIRQYTELPFPVAVAVLPKLPHTAACARIVRASGQELMLHQPMQAQNLSLYPGEGAVLPDMTLSEIYRQVAQNIAELGPGVKGLNNHEGSLISCDVLKIGAVLDAVSDADLYFVDSRTTAQTQAPQAALERGMEILHRDVFIDDIISREEMLAQIYRGIGIANKNGTAVLIGHVDKSVSVLPPLLSDMYPQLKKSGYRIAFPSQAKN